MLKHIETHKSDTSKTEDVYNENGELLFTVQYYATLNDVENKYVIDYVRAHAPLGSECPLEAYQKLLEEEKNQQLAKATQPSFKQLRAKDPEWTECQKAAKLLLKQGLRTQVKTLIREYNKSHSMI